MIERSRQIFSPSFFHGYDPTYSMYIPRRGFIFPAKYIRFAPYPSSSTGTPQAACAAASGGGSRGGSARWCFSADRPLHLSDTDRIPNRKYARTGSSNTVFHQVNSCRPHHIERTGVSIPAGFYDSPAVLRSPSMDGRNNSRPHAPFPARQQAALAFSHCWDRAK